MKNTSLSRALTIFVLLASVVSQASANMDPPKHEIKLPFPFISYITAETVTQELNYRQLVTLPAGTPVNVLRCRARGKQPAVCEIQWGLYEYNPPPYRGWVSAYSIYNPFK